MVSASEFKSEDPGLDPLVGQGEWQFFCLSESTLMQTFSCLTPLCVYGAHKLIKIHISICHKRVGLRVGGMETQKQCIQGEGGGGGGGGGGRVALYHGSSLSPAKTTQISSALH